jgi:hypothetical protein
MNRGGQWAQADVWTNNDVTMDMSTGVVAVAHDRGQTIDVVTGALQLPVLAFGLGAHWRGGGRGTPRSLARFRAPQSRSDESGPRQTRFS